MKAGYIKLHRQIQDNEFLNSDRACNFRAWVDLLMLASHNEHKVVIKNHPIVLSRGDFVVSFRFLQKRWKWGSRKTQRFIEWLIRDQMVSKKQHGSGHGSPSIYTIVNYDRYQVADSEEQHASQHASSTLPAHFQHETNNGKKGKELDRSLSSSGSVNIEREYPLFPVAEKRNGHRDRAYDIFAEAFKASREIPYLPNKGDFVQLTNLRKRLQIESRAVPDKWQEAISNYFHSSLSSYTLAHLCTKYDIFRANPIDRYGKPDVPEEDYFTKLRRQLEIEEK